MRCRNLSNALAKLTCFNMIKAAFGFAGFDAAALQNLQPQLNVLRFEKPTDATES